MKFIPNISVPLIALAVASFCSTSYANPLDLETGFDSNGELIVDFYRAGASSLYSNTFLSDVATTKSGKIIVVGYANKGSSLFEGVVASYNQNGTLDNIEWSYLSFCILCP